MSVINSTPIPTASKPTKPYDDFPLFPHATGRWAKKTKGRMCYFGPWSDWQAALAKYNEQKGALHAGRKPRPDPDALRIKDLANAFLAHKDALIASGELSKRTRVDYKDVCDLLVEKFGKCRMVADVGPDDFAELRKYLTSKWGHSAMRMPVARTIPPPSR